MKPDIHRYKKQSSWRDIRSMYSSHGGDFVCSPNVVVLQISEDSL